MQYNDESRQSLAAPVSPGAHPVGWTRRSWLATNMVAVLATRLPIGKIWLGRGAGRTAALVARMNRHAERAEPEGMESLARHAVAVAQAAGAQYADARLTRTVQHHYSFPPSNDTCPLMGDIETIGLGVRALVDGAWGFAASAGWNMEEATRLAQAAVLQARTDARHATRPVSMGGYPAVQGRWATPVQRDPFTVPLDEKADYLQYWRTCTERIGMFIDQSRSGLHIARQERTVATSDGSCVTQAQYESGGKILVITDPDPSHGVPPSELQGLQTAGKGWELFLEAHIPVQIQALAHLPRPTVVQGTVGRYSLVCDGATMASLVAETFGIATQLDRALGYEANAGGTSYLDDPLGMVGHLQVAGPAVTVTANRSAPTQLATVRWDDEGVVPVDTPLVKAGVLVDFQTTREQAAWLEPYYTKGGQPVRSHGYAAAQDALSVTLQQQPNLALEPGPAADVTLEALIQDVRTGILVTNGSARTDQQARNGTVTGQMYKIVNGKRGMAIGNMAVLFSTMDLWKNVIALGGSSTTMVVPSLSMMNLWTQIFDWDWIGKGQPAQLVSHSASGVAATIQNQALIIESRKA